MADLVRVSLSIRGDAPLRWISGGAGRLQVRLQALTAVCACLQPLHSLAGFLTWPVLSQRRAANVRMAIASRTPTPPVATAWMRRLGEQSVALTLLTQKQKPAEHRSDRGVLAGIASGYFESVQLIPYTQKDTTHFPKIQHDTGVPYSKMLFFDDESGNITRVSCRLA